MTRRFRLWCYRGLHERATMRADWQAARYWQRLIEGLM